MVAVVDPGRSVFGNGVLIRIGPRCYSLYRAFCKDKFVPRCAPLLVQHLKTVHSVETNVFLGGCCWFLESRNNFLFYNQA